MKKTCKKLFSVVCCAAMFFNFGVYSFAHELAQIEEYASERVLVSVGNAQGEPGTTVEVPVFITENPGQETIGFYVEYDNSLSLDENATAKSYTSEIYNMAALDAVTVNTAKNPIMYSAAAVNGATSATGKVFSVFVRIPENAAVGSSYSINAYDANDIIGGCYIGTTRIPIEYENGTVTVIEPQKPVSPDECDVVVSVKEIKARPGSTVKVPVELTKNPGQSTIGFGVLYDEGLEFDKNATVASLNEAKDVYNTSIGNVTINAAQNPVIYSSVSSNGDVSAVGTLFYMYLKVPENAADGTTYSVSPVAVEESIGGCFSNTDELSLGFESGCIIVDGNTKNSGDIDGDGIINRKDLMLVTKFFAGMNVQIDMINADVNGDGVVNRLDLLLISKYFAGIIKSF
ncbi:MAG TPA: hypothetical protein DCG28_04385 [Lachnospiraceae bacterium]|nr:hypothetical protein [Lachnospiraceae bacterium]